MVAEQADDAVFGEEIECGCGAGAEVDGVAGVEDEIGGEGAEVVEDGAEGVDVGVEVGEDGDAHG